MKPIISPMSMDELHINSSPDTYPEHIDIIHRHIKFCAMSRASYRASPFLDQRIVRAHGSLRTLSFDAIPHHSKIPAPGAVCYIFHNAFCCSTLLTRYLDSVNNSFVLREPHSLFEIASYIRFNGTSLFHPVAQDDLLKLYRYITCMLSRRYQEKDHVVIKPTDGCNNLIANLVGDNPSNRAIFLYSGLERFLSSIFRIPGRGEWAKIRVRELSLDKQRLEGQISWQPDQLDQGQTSAMVWALHMERFRAFLQNDREGQAIAIDSQDLVEQPLPTLTRVVKHFDLKPTVNELKTAVKTSAISKNAKAQNEDYSHQVREKDFQQARTQYASEIEQATRWIETIFGTDFIKNPLIF